MGDLATVTTAAVSEPTEAVLVNSRIRWTSPEPVAQETTLKAKPDRGHAAVIPHNPEHAPAIAAWLASTMGLISLWHAATHYHNGRSYFALEQLRNLTVPDLNAMSPETLRQMAEIRPERLNAGDPLPLARSWQDQSLIAADRRLLKALGVDPKAAAALEHARNLWCLEPSVLGNAGNSPANAGNMAQLRKLAQQSGRQLKPIIPSVLASMASILRPPAKQTFRRTEPAAQTR